MVELVGAGAVRVEPDRARLALPEFGAIGLHHERSGQPPRLLPAKAPDQVDAHGDVPPLVAPSELEAAAERVEQVEEVVRLEEHVAELGVGDALLGSCQPGSHRVLRGHLTDGEVLAHVSEELEERQRAEPLRVVDEDCGRPPSVAVEVEKAPQLGVDALGVPT